MPFLGTETPYDKLADGFLPARPGIAMTFDPGIDGRDLGRAKADGKDGFGT